MNKMSVLLVRWLVAVAAVMAVSAALTLGWAWMGVLIAGIAYPHSLYKLPSCVMTAATLGGIGSAVVVMLLAGMVYELSLQGKWK